VGIVTTPKIQLVPPQINFKFNPLMLAQQLRIHKVSKIIIQQLRNKFQINNIAPVHKEKKPLINPGSFETKLTKNSKPYTSH